MHLNIDFSGDTIAYIPESDSLTRLKGSTYYIMKLPPPPHMLQFKVTKQDKSEGLCVFPFGTISE